MAWHHGPDNGMPTQEHIKQTNLRVAMVQDGARRAYALPIALHKAHHLQVMYTDWYDRPGKLEHTLGRILTHLKPALAAKLTTRCHGDLTDAPISSWPFSALKHRLASRRFDAEADYYLHVAQSEARIMIRRQFHHANLLLGCIRNLHPHLLQIARERGIVTVGDQIIAPAAVEIAEAKRQTQRWPGWQDDVVEKNVHASRRQPRHVDQPGPSRNLHSGKRWRRQRYTGRGEDLVDAEESADCRTVPGRRQ